MTKLVFPQDLYDAVVIGDPCDPGTPSSAALVVNVRGKGILVSRLTSTEIDAITDPAEGLLIYDTVAHQFLYFNGGSWTPIGVGSGGPGPTGPTGPAGASFFNVDGGTASAVYLPVDSLDAGGA